MKNILLFCLCFVCLSASAQITLFVKTDLAQFNNVTYPTYNLTGNAGDGCWKSIDAIIRYNRDVRGNAPLVLLFPDGAYKFDTSINPENNITFKLASGTVWYSTASSLFGSTGALFESIAHSNVRIIGEPGATITNNFSKYVYGLVWFKADPNKCTGNEVRGITLKNSWCHAALAGANTGSDTASTYWTDLTFVKDSILNIYNPSKPHMLSGSDYGTTADCNGIDILQAYHSVLIDAVVVINTGSDNIRGYGLNKGLAKNQENGHVEIRNSYLKNGNMNVEINGNYCPWLMYIHDNQMFYPFYVGGFNISTQGKPLIIKDNYLLAADNGNTELSPYGGEISGNTMKMIAYRDTIQGGWQHAAGSQRGSNVSLYGFLSDVHNNRFDCDTTGKGASSPPEWNGIAMITRASVGDTAFDRKTMAGLSYMGGHNIHNNIFNGQTHRVYDNTNDTTENVTFADNIINAYNHYGTDELIGIKGFGMKILRNQINMKGSTAPINGHAIIKRIAGAGEVVDGNIISGGSSLWFSNSSLYYLFRQQ